jgi:hypothetical protein
VGQGALQQRLFDRLELVIGDLGRRPLDPRVRNAVIPSACQRACQRPALWRDTSSSRATSAWVRPWANNSAARSRRA